MDVVLELKKIRLMMIPKKISSNDDAEFCSHLKCFPLKKVALSLVG